MRTQTAMLASVRAMIPDDGLNIYLIEAPSAAQTPYAVIWTITDPAHHYFHSDQDAITSEDELEQAVIQIDIFNKRTYKPTIVLGWQDTIYNVLHDATIGGIWKLHCVDRGAVRNEGLYQHIAMTWNVWQVAVTS